MTPDKVQLVGSVALDRVDEVFRTVGGLLGRRIRRVPDGEPGGRRLWISWQYPFLRAQPFLKPDTSLPNPRGMQPLMLAENADPAAIRFGELGYAREVCRAIPHRDLCIQWDVCIEMLLWDGRWEAMRNPFGDDLQSEIMKRMKRLGAAVPEDVELGFHLCYGDYDARHFVEPLDAGKLVEVASALAATMTRPITYIHMPVPIDRADDDYFRPLRELHLAAETELYLGLVHQDGIEGTNRRIATAGKFVLDFGIATECGITRLKTPDQVRKLLEIHAGASREPAARAGSA